jgi:hypothetical protein
LILFSERAVALVASPLTQLRVGRPLADAVSAQRTASARLAVSGLTSEAAAFGRGK